MIVRFVPQHHSALFECTNDERVCFKYLDTRIVGNFLREFTSTIYWHNQFDAIVFTYLIVVFTKTWRHMHHTSSIFGSHEGPTEHAERTSMIGEIRKQRRVALTN